MLRLSLRKDLARHIRDGHPWIYRDALAPTTALRSGEVVDVVDGQGAFLGRGRYEAESPIAVRIYTRDPEEAVDGALLRRRLAAALRLREATLADTETTAYRLCNGEGDGLPGVVVDRYDAVAVVRFDDAAAAAWRDDLVAALQALLPLRAVVERSRGVEARVLAGEAHEGELLIQEYGTPLWVDVLRGQKTGLFLDQRDNRRLLRRYARGRSVLNCFCYTGGFSVQAALGGAAQVVSVDSAAAALETARRNFAVNGLPGHPHQFLAEDVFVHLRRAVACKVRHGLVIVDPPSFAPSERSLPRALAAYRELLALAVQVVEPGGLLAAASCSSHVTMTAFLEVLAQAAGQADAGRRGSRGFQILEVRGQPADHPSPAAFPEGRYLKFVLGAL